MPEQTLGQTLDSLVFRMGRVENWIARFMRLRAVSLKETKEMVKDFEQLGQAIGVDSRLVQKEKFYEITQIVPPVMPGYLTYLADKITTKTKIYPPIRALPIECPACHMRFRTKLSLKSHIVNDNNWGRRKFRALHRDVRAKQVWRA